MDFSGSLTLNKKNEKMAEAMPMVKFSFRVFSVIIMTINNKNEKNDGSKYLGLTVSSYCPKNTLKL